MKKLTYRRYGSPVVIEFGDVDVPSIGDDGVLVRVRASSVNAADWHLLRGRPVMARVITGLRAPKSANLGTDVAGVVEAVGKDVTEFRAGDEVFGSKDGAWADYVAGRERNFTRKPPNVSFEQAAAIPVAATTALQALRDSGRVQPGQAVLILGAGGGVGTFAVQLAKAMGANVTAATRGDLLETVAALGAGDVVDYEREDVTRRAHQFDVVVDVAGFRSLGDLKRAVKRDGNVVLVGAGKSNSAALITRLAVTAVRSRLRGERLLSFLAHLTKDDLVALADHAAAGRIAAVIDRTYPLAEIGDAIRHVESGRARGKVVVLV